MSRATMPHGTPAAARRHYRHGEKPCTACLDAGRRDKSERAGADPYAPAAQYTPREPARKQPPTIAYRYGASRDNPRYSWAVANIRKAEAIYGTPEADREAG
jgi:hypothetical protein